MNVLGPAFAKLKRAEAHITELKPLIEAFLKSDCFRLARKIDGAKKQEVWSIEVKPIPAEIETIAADAVHNLRTPLDKMLAAGFPCSALHTPKSSIQKLKFPGVQHPNELATILNQLGQHLTAPVIKFISDTEPYKGGAGQAICAINALDNRDKHRALLEPIKLGFSTLGIGNFMVSNGDLLRIGSPRGSNLTNNRDGYFTAPTDEARPILREDKITGKKYLEFKSQYNDMEMFTTSPNSKIQMEFWPFINISFIDSEEFEGIPVIDSLNSMKSTVERILGDFRSKFF